MNSLVTHNSKAWDNKVESGNEWTVAVEKRIIEKAKNGEWDIRLTPTKDVPKEWFPSV
ncbi:SAM-dependent methyltransferase, partial [Bacillus atrophaeus]|nr:SAM-dependent methyltransferase [Bacillus atrophaeus]